MTDKFYGGGHVDRADQRPSSNFRKVEEFMRAFDQQIPSTPTIPDEKVQKLRYDLIDEELTELHCGMQNGDIIEIADALTDLLYVVYGAGLAYGIDLDKIFTEVHRSNMTKLGADGKPQRREDGKVIKGPSYEPPRIDLILALQE